MAGHTLGRLALVAALAGGVVPPVAARAGTVTLLNVSYDPTRELYQEFNAAFAEHWKASTGQDVVIQQSHGGSGEQARAVIEKRDADVVTLALAWDIDALQQAGLIKPGWQKRLAHRSCPYTSRIVFLVRQGNPKNIRDWSDLVRPGVSVITPDPKTSGGARWNYLAAWGWALEQWKSDEARAREFVATLFLNVPVPSSGARGSTITFMLRGIGDVLVTWENEALRVAGGPGGHAVEVVTPSLTIEAEPPVALVDTVVERKGTRRVAEAYLEYLYSTEGQTIAARHFYRPRDPSAEARAAVTFPRIRTFTIDQVFGGWAKAHQVHFRDGGVFDQIHRPPR